MESFEFLGGRYNRPEQIMSGPVQAFRAQNAADGQTVFIHRVSTTEAPEEQAALLKLLTTALVKSADTKRLVLDFGEERGYWYVVTGSEPQCALLREWLHLEIEAAAANGRPINKPTAPVAAPSPALKQEQTDPGEFTRFLQARPSTSSPASTARLVVPQPIAASQPIEQQAATPKSAMPTGPANADQAAGVGEFTQLFRGSPAKPLAPPSMSTPPASSPIMAAAVPQSAPPVQATEDASPELGEFTQFFRPSEGAAGAKPSAAISASAIPAMPPPLPPSEPDEAVRPKPGEFTGFFNTSDAERRQPKATPPPAQQRPPNFPAPNFPAPNFPAPNFAPPNTPPPNKATGFTAAPAAESHTEPGEFTRFFKPGLPAVPSKASASTPQTMNFDRTQPNPSVQRPKTPVPLPPPTAPKPVERVGEFTQLFSRPDNAGAPSKPPASNYVPPPPVRSDPMGFAKQPSKQADDLADNLFHDRIDIPQAQPSQQQKESDFTQLFGKGGAAPPPMQKQSVVAAPRENPMLDGPPVKEDPLRATQPFSLPNQQAAAPGAGEPASSSPSEFTRIMQGGYGPAKPVGGAGGAGAPHGGGSGSPIMGASATPINPMGALPGLGGVGGSIGPLHGFASLHGASVGTPLGTANVRGPGMPPMKVPSGGANKKMVILFSVIGVLAILLIMLMMFVLKNK